jgi:hypothetical protein
LGEEWISRGSKTDINCACSPDSTEQGAITLLLQRVDRLVRKGGSRLLEGLEPGVQIDEAELEV